MRKKLYLFLAFLMPFCTHAVVQQDSLLLQEVEVRGIPYARYAVGQKIVTIDSTIIKQYLQANIGDILAATHPVYIRSYGNNMAAGISFRGTGPSHTGVFWNGININSRTLGQSDFSLLPVIGADEISLQYGASGALYGSDAIGGTVHLNNTPDWLPGVKMAVQQGGGSFGVQQTAGIFSLTKGKFNVRSRFYYQSSENDFEYTIPSTGEIVKQNNAAFTFYGFTQDINIHLASNRQLIINAWYNDNQRELQPVRGNFTDSTEQKDRNLRLTAAYRHHSKFAYWTFRTGFIHDYQIYDNALAVTGKQFINRIQFEKKFKHLSINGGANWNHIVGNSDSYESQEEEDRIDLFLLTTYQLKALVLSANVRQNFISNYPLAFAPAFNAKYQLSPSWQITAQLSRNYRVPTLNDRFWNPGGNRDLKPEISRNIETGMEYKKKNFTFSSSYYKMWVTDWIIWLPESNYWTPKNIRKVNSEGIESTARIHTKWNAMNINLIAGYSYNLATPTNSTSSIDRSIGRQLPYTPKHNANLSFNIKSNIGYLLVTSRYTGERSTLGSTIMEDYILTDVMIGKTIDSPFGSFDFNFNIKNIANQEYEAVLNRAMPGRNYQLNIKYTFQTKK